MSPANFLHFKRYSIKTKLIVMMLSIVLISASLISSILLSQYLNNYEKQLYEAKQQTLDQLGFNIQTYFDELYRLMLSTYSNEFLMETLEDTSAKTPFERLEKRRNVESFLDDMMITPRQDILSVYILMDEIYRGGKHVASVDPSVSYTELEWYQQAMESTGRVFVPAHTEELITNPKYTVFSFVKRINSLHNSEKSLGVIKVDANVSGLRTLCEKVSTGKNGAMMIVDQNDQLQFSTFDDQAMTNQFLAHSPTQADSKLVKMGEQHYIYNKTNIENLNWSIVTFNSTEELELMTKNTVLVTIVTVLLCFLLTTVILLLFSSHFLKPLLSVIHLMKQVQKGDLTVRFPENRQDEIGYLGTSFNQMIVKIDQTMELNGKLLTEIYQANLLQNKAKLTALQNQIKPHFIYNTLNMISMQVQCNKQENAVENINRLCFLMRAMTKMNATITIEKELSLLTAYLEIQANRYANRLAYKFNLSDSTLKKTIPALFLQPIVENCIVHGCEANPDKTTVTIYENCDSDGIHICIQDDALGIDKETLSSLQQQLANVDYEQLTQSVETEGGIGLTNINARIKLTFGLAFGLTIESEKGKGTKVTVHLPSGTLQGKSPR